MKFPKKVACIVLAAALSLCFAGCKGKNSATRYDCNMRKYVSFTEKIGNMNFGADTAEFREFSQEFIRSAVLENGVLTRTYDVSAAAGDEVSITLSAPGTGEKKEYDVKAGDTEFIYLDIANRLIGKKAGDSFSCKIRNIDGTEVLLEVNVTSVKLPVLTDNVAENMGYGNKELCEKALDAEAYDAYVLKKLRDKAEITDYPQAEYAALYQQKTDYYTSLADGYKMTLEEYKSSKGLSDAQFEEKLKTEVHAEMDAEMPAYAFFRIKKLKVTKQQISDKTNALAEKHNSSAAAVTEQSYSGYIERLCVEDTVSEYLKSKK